MSKKQKTNKKVGAIGLIALLIGGSAGLYLSPELFDSAYYCSATDRILLFDTVVDTQGYLYDTNNNMISVGCSTGWESVSAYCKKENLDCEKFMQSHANAKTMQSIEYVCNSEGCQISKCEVV